MRFILWPVYPMSRNSFLRMGEGVELCFVKELNRKFETVWNTEAPDISEAEKREVTLKQEVDVSKYNYSVLKAKIRNASSKIDSKKLTVQVDNGNGTWQNMVDSDKQKSYWKNLGNALGFQSNDAFSAKMGFTRNGEGKYEFVMGPALPSNDKDQKNYQKAVEKYGKFRVILNKLDAGDVVEAVPQDDPDKFVWTMEQTKDKQGREMRIYRKIHIDSDAAKNAVLEAPPGQKQKDTEKKDKNKTAPSPSPTTTENAAESLPAIKTNEYQDAVASLYAGWRTELLGNATELSSSNIDGVFPKFKNKFDQYIKTSQNGGDKHFDRIALYYSRQSGQINLKTWSDVRSWFVASNFLTDTSNGLNKNILSTSERSFQEHQVVLQENKEGNEALNNSLKAQEKLLSTIEEARIPKQLRHEHAIFENLKEDVVDASGNSDNTNDQLITTARTLGLEASDLFAGKKLKLKDVIQNSTVLKQKYGNSPAWPQGHWSRDAARDFINFLRSSRDTGSIKAIYGTIGLVQTIHKNPDRYIEPDRFYREKDKIFVYNETDKKYNQIQNPPALLRNFVEDPRQIQKYNNISGTIFVSGKPVRVSLKIESGNVKGFDFSTPEVSGTNPRKVTGTIDMDGNISRISVFDNTDQEKKKDLSTLSDRVIFTNENNNLISNNVFSYNSLTWRLEVSEGTIIFKTTTNTNAKGITIP